MNPLIILQEENDVLHSKLQKDKDKMNGAVFMLKTALISNKKKQEIRDLIENSITLLTNI